MSSDELCILTDTLLPDYDEIASTSFLTCMSTARVHPTNLTLSVLSSESEDDRLRDQAYQPAMETRISSIKCYDSALLL